MLWVILKRNKWKKVIFNKFNKKWLLFKWWYTLFFIKNDLNRLQTINKWFSRIYGSSIKKIFIRWI
jgi:hypothetical protein